MWYPNRSSDTTVGAIVGGGAGDRPLRVREGSDEDEAVGREDLAVDEFAPHFLAVGHAEAVEELATGAEIHLAEAHGAAFGPPPATEVIGVGPEAEYEFAWGVEHAGDGEAVVVVVRVGSVGGGVGSGHGAPVDGCNGDCGSFQRMGCGYKGFEREEWWWITARRFGAQRCCARTRATVNVKVWVMSHLNPAI
jgi:hypothetical protein